MLRTHLCCAPLLVLAALTLGCGAKGDDTGENTTSATASATTPTTSSTTATTTAVTTTAPTTDPISDDCDDRSVLCMADPGLDDTTSGGGTAGTAGPGEPMCDALLGQLEAGAQALCSAGFAGIGPLDISDIVGASNQCCYVFHCADTTQTCVPLAEAGACAEEADLGDAALAPQNACNSNIGSGIYPAPKGDFCCSTFQCVCGDTGGG